MSANDLQQLIAMASRVIEPIFRRQGGIDPIVHAIRADQHELIFAQDQLDSYEAFFAKIRLICADGDIIRLVFITEAWTVNLADSEELRAFYASGGLTSEHPRRQECVIFSAEDEIGQMVARRAIIRAVDKQPELGPLKIEPMDVRMEGRFVGLLGRPKATVWQ